MAFLYKPLATVFLASGLLHATAVYADSADMSRLQQQVSAGNSQAAWTQAQSMRNQWESDPTFDFLYGSLALANGNPHEALFALERVLAQENGNVQARFLLGKALYQAGDKENASKQFAAVLNSNPPPAVRREAESYLGKTSTGKNVINGYIEANVGHDNNINSATGANSVITANGTVIDINPDAQKMSDMYSLSKAGVDFFHPLSSNTIVEVKGRFAERDNFSSDMYDTTSYRGSVGLRHQAGSDLFRVTLTAQDFRLSDSDYQRLMGINGDWVHPLVSNLSLLTNVYANSIRYAGSSGSQRDLNQYIGHIGLQLTDGEFTHTTGFMLGDEDTLRDSGDFNARTFTALYYDVRYNLAAEHQLFGRVYVQDSHANGEDPTFKQTKDTLLKQISAGYAWQLTQHWRWKSELGYNDSDSDISYNSFNRTFVQTGVRYSF
jgi:tetratricopeptide (TPR) repeat protein